MEAPDPKSQWPSHRGVRRASRACETCRARKTKCDQAQPCSYCAYHEFDCYYRSPSSGPNPTTRPTQRKRAARAAQQSQSAISRQSPWPEVLQNMNLQVSHQAESPNFVMSDSPRISYPNEGANITPDTPNASTDHQDIPRPASASEVCDSASWDGLSGVNLHTNGTEFYGNSSNLAFLSNLYSRAQNQAENKASNRPNAEPIRHGNFTQGNNAHQPLPSSPHGNFGSGRRRSVPSKARLSIVNLLCNADYTGHPSPESQDGHRSPSLGDGSRGNFNTSKGKGLSAGFGHLPYQAQLEIEKIFIHSYFTNKHYIHPMLDKEAFMLRCENEAWSAFGRETLFRGLTKFGGLYFAVVSLGAINASPNDISLLDYFCQQSTQPLKNSNMGRLTAMDFADFYFGVSRQVMGDMFASSCLETAQALLLLSVFRQNSLQPHSCYMYSGLAVRTAAAIGLASSMSLLPPSAKREAKRTWWCIYSHEIEMCCSSGRLDSMKELDYYKISPPKLKHDTGTTDPDAEDDDVAMIPVMVALAQIMSEASHKLYHSTRLSMSEKSRLAMDLERRLQQWKKDLPVFLDVDRRMLKDPEWAFKQKLVLRLRYYNTQILIHRPFQVAATANPESQEFLEHIHICLDAARTSINMQYESFMHRIYIRTWWYNTTYALYGSMILLHLILSNFPGLLDDELLEDVEKSLEIFSSMDNIIFARRCAEMIREVLEVARTCVARRKRSGENSYQSKPHSHLQDQIQSPTGLTGAAPLTPAVTYTPAAAATPSLGGTTGLISSSPAGALPEQAADPSVVQFPPSNQPDPTTTASSLSFERPLMLTQNVENPSQLSQPDDGNFFFSLFSQDPQQQPDPTRAEMLANLVDPSILEDFAFESAGGGVY